MPRPVIGDHILFDECIDTFRNDSNNTFINHQVLSDEIYCIILSPFIITEIWDLKICSIYPSNIINFPGHYSAFISRVKINQKINSHYAPLFAHALCSILSFLSLKPFKSPRNRYFYLSINNLSVEQLNIIALSHPIQVCGPGAYYTISHAEECSIFEQSKKIITKLHLIDYEKYVIIMQCLRMIQLSIFNKEEDFGLAYLLIVSAIEAIAQKAINGKKIRLKAKYVQFILQYAPVEEWESFVKNPQQEFLDNIKIDFEKYKALGINANKEKIERFFSGEFPIDLSYDEIKSMLENSYKHRSLFVHEGKQPPHRNPASHTRFFQSYSEFKNNEYIRTLLPNYELMSAIAKNSILKWIEI